MIRNIPFLRFLIILLILFSMLSLSGVVSAHKIYVDTQVKTFEVMEVEIEAYYGDGKAVKAGDVKVLRASGKTFVMGKTDNEGKFSFQINSTIGNETLTIEVTQSGHKATYDIEVSGKMDKVILKGSGEEGSIPTYQGIISAFGYLLGLVGLVSLFSAWRLNRQNRQVQKQVQNHPPQAAKAKAAGTEPNKLSSSSKSLPEKKSEIEKNNKEIHKIQHNKNQTKRLKK